MKEDFLPASTMSQMFFSLESTKFWLFSSPLSYDKLREIRNMLYFLNTHWMEVLEYHIYIYLYIHIHIYAACLKIFPGRWKYTLQCVKVNFSKDPMVRFFCLILKKGQHFWSTQGTSQYSLQHLWAGFLKWLAPRVQLMPQSLAICSGIKKKTEKFRNH